MFLICGELSGLLHCEIWHLPEGSLQNFRAFGSFAILKTLLRGNYPHFLMLWCLKTGMTSQVLKQSTERAVKIKCICSCVVILSIKIWCFWFVFIQTKELSMVLNCICNMSFRLASAHIACDCPIKSTEPLCASWKKVWSVSRVSSSDFLCAMSPSGG